MDLALDGQDVTCCLALAPAIWLRTPLPSTLPVNGRFPKGRLCQGGGW